MQPSELIGKTETFRRCQKLNSELILLGDGDNPPSEMINPDYKQQLSNPRKCGECGKTHDTIVENTMTGERLEEIDKCKDCLFKTFFGMSHIADNYRGEDEMDRN